MSTGINGGFFSGVQNSRLNAGYFQPFWFTEQTPVMQNRQSGSGIVTSYYKDRVYNSGTSVTVTDYEWLYNYTLDRPVIQPITGITSNSGIIYQSPSNPYIWTYSGSGAATISLSCAARTVSHIVTTSALIGSSLQQTGFVTGSAAATAQQNISNRISGLTASTGTLNLFSVQDNTNGIYIRNTGCWAHDIDLSCFSPWNSDLGSEKAGTLISPRHIFMANHFPIGIGNTIRFVDYNNNVVTRTLINSVYVGSDVLIGILDSDVPSGINFVPVINSGNLSQLPAPASNTETSAYPWNLAALSTNQFKQAYVTNVRSEFGGLTVMGYPTDPQQLSFNLNAIGGDSGSPSFYIISGKALFITHWWGGGAGDGPDYTLWTNGINSGMHSLSVAAGASTDYQLTSVNLSGFLSF